ncbi:hypothetical protein Trydic_g23184 [Trypoxylus dichotomus]
MKRCFANLFLLTILTSFLASNCLLLNKLNLDKPCFWIFKRRFPPRPPPTPVIPITTSTTQASPTTTSASITTTQVAPQTSAPEQAPTTTKSPENDNSADTNNDPSQESVDARNAGGAGASEEVDGVQDESTNMA